MQAALDLQAESLVAWLNAPKRPASVNARRHIAGWYYPAPYGVYATRNGHIAVSLCPLQSARRSHRRAAAGFVLRQGYLESAGRDRRADRGEAEDESTEEWSPRMEQAQIWHARVQGYDDLVEDPQVKHMQVLVTVRGAGETGAPITLVNHPVRYDGEAAAIRLPPPSARRADQGRSSPSLVSARPRLRRSLRDGVVRARDIVMRFTQATQSSWPGLSRPSMSCLCFRRGRRDVRADKRWHSLRRWRRDMQDFYVKVGDTVTFAKTVGRNRHLSLCRDHRRLLGQSRQRAIHGALEISVSASHTAR